MDTKLNNMSYIKEKIVAYVDVGNRVYGDSLGNEYQVEPNTAYLVKEEGTVEIVSQDPFEMDNANRHIRIVSDQDGNLSIQDRRYVITPPVFEEKDTLETVVNKGNISPREILFKDKDGDLAGLYYTPNYNYVFASDFNTSATGSSNIVIGNAVLNGLSSGKNNVALGNYTGNKSNGSENVLIGTLSGNTLQGLSNVVIGSRAGTVMSSASNNVILGTNAGQGVTEGAKNIIVGFKSAQSLNTFSYHNVLLGSEVAPYSASGYHNVFIGYQAGRFNYNSSSNIQIGSHISPISLSYIGMSEYGSNNIHLGYSIEKYLYYSEIFKGDMYPELIPPRNKMEGTFIVQIGDFEAAVDTNVSEVYGGNGEIAAGAQPPMIFGSRYTHKMYFGARIIIDKRFISSDSSYTKNVVMKPNGTLGSYDRMGLDFPQAPMEGDIFFNTSTKKHYGYDGTQWNQLY